MIIKNIVLQLLQDAVEVILPGNSVKVEISAGNNLSNGEYSSNVALILAKPNGLNPRDLATSITSAIVENELIERVQIAGPGFINFYISNRARQLIVSDVVRLRDSYGVTNIGEGKKVLLEFVSANPTGPLHVGHGRNAIFGSVLANLLRLVGFDVTAEYYVNDAGRQMDILAVSVYLRYLELMGCSIKLPQNVYKGIYVIDIAKEALNNVKDKYKVQIDKLFDNLPKDSDEGGDKELYIDALIDSCKNNLFKDGFDYFHNLGLDWVLDGIKEDLSEISIHMNWFHESSLNEKGLVDEVIRKLKDSGYVFSNEGALWFKSTAFGDEKDRVLVRTNGQYTYFAMDLAYHHHKYHRGFYHKFDVFGADHHGYVPRVEAGLKALGHDLSSYTAFLVQFATLFRGKERIQMSTRSGSFVTLRQLFDEIGKDATRFFYVMRKIDQHMEFDLELAKKQSTENPVFYVQYAHARICSIYRQKDVLGYEYSSKIGLENLDILDSKHEKILITHIMRYPEVILSAARDYQPHLIVNFLKDCSASLHSYYANTKFLVDDIKIRSARLLLVGSIRQILANGLGIIDISTPENM